MTLRDRRRAETTLAPELASDFSARPRLGSESAATGLVLLATALMVSLPAPQH